MGRPAMTTRPWWFRFDGAPPSMPASDDNSAGVSMLYFWEKADKIRSPDQHEFLVGITAAGVPRTPFSGGAFLAIFGLPLHWAARSKGRAWRVEVVDLQQRKAALRTWRPRPSITVVAEARDKSAAQSAARKIVMQIQQEGWQKVL